MNTHNKPCFHCPAVFTEGRFEIWKQVSTGKKRESQTIKENRKSRFVLEGRQIIDEI